jgi:phosphoribosylanthranilate isomerase
VWKAFRVSEAQAVVPDYPAAEAIMLDGKAFDWTRTAHFTKPLILGGGLDPENVQDRIAAARRSGKLWGVDVASGVEAWPGRKDHARMKKFIEAANRS